MVVLVAAGWVVVGSELVEMAVGVTVLEAQELVAGAATAAVRLGWAAVVVLDRGWEGSSAERTGVKEEAAMVAEDMEAEKVGVGMVVGEMVVEHLVECPAVVGMA